MPGIGPGTRLSDRYELESPIGRGGMSVVWKARHLRLEQRVAIKILPEIIQNDLRQKKALIDEANLVTRLSHPGIRKIVTLDDDATYGAYVVMDLIEGITLDDALAARRGSLSGDEVFTIATQCCAALAHAHELKIIHRDLKPKNIFLEGLGLEEMREPIAPGRIRVKVTDFGLSVRIRESVAALSAPGAGPSGTLAYMSPEQLMGEVSAPAMDVYSLGATLHELLSGAPPFAGGDVATQILHKPAPRLHESAASPVLREAVAACLAKLPADRPPTMAALAARLGGKAPERAAPSAARTATEPAGPHQKSRASAGLVGGAVAVTAALVLGGLWSIRNVGPTEPAVARPIPTPTASIVVAEPVRSPGIRPETSASQGQPVTSPPGQERSRSTPAPTTEARARTDKRSDEAPGVADRGAAGEPTTTLVVLSADDSGASAVRSIVGNALRDRGVMFVEANREGRSGIQIVARLSAEAVDNGGFEGLVSMRVRLDLSCAEPGRGSCGSELLSMAGAGFSKSTSVENAISKLEPRLKTFVGGLRF